MLHIPEWKTLISPTVLTPSKEATISEEYQPSVDWEFVKSPEKLVGPAENVDW